MSSTATTARRRRQWATSPNPHGRRWQRNQFIQTPTVRSLQGDWCHQLVLKGGISIQRGQTLHVFIGRLDKDTTVELVSEHVETNGIQVSRVSQLTSREEWQKKGLHSESYSTTQRRIDHLILKFWIGTLNRPPSRRLLKMMLFTPRMTSSDLSSTTNSNPFHMCSFNMHGFANGVSMVKILCWEFNIVQLQERWLLKDNLYKLCSIDSIFFYLCCLWQVV